MSADTPLANASRRASALAITLSCSLALTWAGRAAAQEADFRYVVRPGDNPWNLTERYLKSIDYWPRIQTYNDITAPRAIPPGTVLRIPVAWMRGDNVPARVTDLRGVVSAQRDGETRALTHGMEVSPGEVIRTAADSSLTLAFADGSRTLLGANAELRLQTLRRLTASEAQQVEVELRRGELDNLVQPNRTGGRFIIHTPAAVAAVRGTDFRAAATAEVTRVETLGGEVTLRNRHGAIRLPAGVGSLATPNRRPESAAALLPAPDLGGLPERVERLPFEVPIPPLAGASAYRSQIAPSGGFSVLSSDRRMSEAAAFGSAELADGEYLIRVRGIDPRGLEGRDAQRSIVIDARPEPPYPSTPAANAVASDDGVRFAWASIPGAAAYHFELADEATFASPIMREDGLVEAGLRVDAELGPGTYFWRVAVTTADEGRGPFSDPQRFRRLASGPADAAADIDGGKLQLRWRDTPLATGYRIQLSQSPDFDAPQYDLHTTTAELVIDTPPSGTYHVRIRHIEADGATGPWGKPQTLEVPYNHWRALLLLLPLLAL